MVFLRRADFKVYKHKAIEIISLILVVVGSLFFEYYNINNLPLVDFRPWKVGNRLIPENPEPVKYYLTYKHIKSGEEQEYLSKDLRFVEFKPIGYEAKMGEWLDKIRKG